MNGSACFLFRVYIGMMVGPLRKTSAICQAQCQILFFFLPKIHHCDPELQGRGRQNHCFKFQKHLKFWFPLTRLQHHHHHHLITIPNNFPCKELSLQTCRAQKGSSALDSWCKYKTKSPSVDQNLKARSCQVFLLR